MHRFFLSLLAWASLMLPVFSQAGPAPVNAGPPVKLPDVACLVVDSDANMDDLRALAIVAPHRRIAAIIATEGILPLEAGAQTLAQFYGQHPGH